MRRSYNPGALRHGDPNPHYRLTGRIKRLSNLRNGYACFDLFLYLFLLGYRKGRWSSKGFPFGLSTFNPCIGPFDQQITLKLSHSVNNLHGHLACWAGKVNATQGQTMNLDARSFQTLNSSPYVHRITSKTVKLRHDQYVPCFQLVEQLSEPLTFQGSYRTRYRFGHDALFGDGKACCCDFLNLVLRGLVVGRNTAVSEQAGHGIPMCTKVMYES